MEKVTELVGGFLRSTASWLVDYHLYSVIAANAFGVFNSVLIHSGYEVFPSWWSKSKWTRWWLSPMNHDRHHALFTCNDGGFTTLWDRAMGTIQPGYDELYTRSLETGTRTDLRAESDAPNLATAG